MESSVVSELKRSYVDHMRKFSPSKEALPGDLRMIADIVDDVVGDRGVDVAIEFSKRLHGTSLYIHNSNSLRRDHRNKWILEMCSLRGATARVISWVTGGEVGERQVKKIWEVGA